MKPLERMQLTGLKDNKDIIYESRIKSYFISKHQLGKGILRLIDIPWNALARNAIFKSVVVNGLLQFDSNPSNNVLAIQGPPATNPIPDNEVSLVADLPTNDAEYQLFQDLGNTLLQYGGDVTIWSSKKVLADTVGLKLDDALLIGWKSLAKRHRTANSRMTAFENWCFANPQIHI